jgi:putative nucleotidyltransferase with HDIG domain
LTAQDNPISRIIPFRPLSGKGLDSVAKRKLIYWGLFLLVFVSMTAILSWKYFPARIYQEGVVASRDFLAPRTFEVENKQATQEAQSRAMNEVQPVYKVDPALISRIDAQLKTQFQIFHQLRRAKGLGDDLRVKELKSQLPINVSDASLSAFVNSNTMDLEQMEIQTRDLVMRNMKDVIRDDDIPILKEKRQKVRNAAAGLTFPVDQSKAVAELASEAIHPNAVNDWEETSRQKQLKKDSVQPVMITIKKGQKIISKGDITNPDHILILESMGLQRTRANLSAIAASATLTLMSVLLTWLFIRRSKPELADNPLRLLLLIIITVGSALLCSLLVQVNPYWAPVPVASILTAILLGPRIAVVITGFLSMMVGIMTGEVQYLVVALITGTAGSLLSWKVRERLDLMTASLLVFVVNEISITIFSLLQGETTQAILENLVFGGINGFSSGVVAIGLLPLLEFTFGITTDIKLLELSSQSEPLMKRLLLEAPGTYHHSIIVGNLAEAGGEAVGEDPLLCRVAAYYHDIGKLRRPYFFIENQLGQENPHHNLIPRLSSLIIVSHVRDGLDLARQYKLPTPIQEIIHQHHGNGIVAYFYHQAKQNSKEEPLEKDYRYHCPLPSTKAAAIVMLADSAEAAARTIQEPTPPKIETLVRSIFKKALDEGQLDQCPLSLRDINNLINSFTSILTGIYHHRIEYPEQILDQENNATSIFPPSNGATLNKQAG